MRLSARDFLDLVGKENEDEFRKQLAKDLTAVQQGTLMKEAINAAVDRAVADGSIKQILQQKMHLMPRDQGIALVDTAIRYYLDRAISRLLTDEAIVARLEAIVREQKPDINAIVQEAVKAYANAK